MTRSLAPMSLALLLSACAPSQPPSADATADLILINGHVVTLADVEPDPAPTAVAIGAGRILTVGDDETVLARRTDATRVVDLDGAAVIPGFIDSHCHLYGLGKALAQVDLRDTGSPEQILQRVTAAVAEMQGDGWLEGRGWDQNDWPVQDYPTATQLDTATGDRPALLRRIDGHAAWVNTAALSLAGITAATPDPTGGAIVRDVGGAPTGILIDNAVDLVFDIVPEPADTEVRRRVKLAVDHCLELGLTGVHEAGVSWERARLYREMAAAGDLPLRIYGMYDDEAETLEEALAAGPTGTEDGMLVLRAIKMYADGALGSRGALLLADYSDRPGQRGLAVSTEAYLRDVARRGAEAGFQLCTHAIGDGANRMVLDIYEDVLRDLELRDARWRIEHAQILDPADIGRFADLGVIAAMQPMHCTSDMDWADERLGEDRLAGAYAWRSLLDTGADLCFGTDFPVEKVDPLEGLYAARTRMHPDGTPPGGWRAHEALDGRTALRLYTAGGAWAAFQENELGRVEPGFRADLTVLAGDPATCNAKELLRMETRHTIVNGRLVWSAPANSDGTP